MRDFNKEKGNMHDTGIIFDVLMLLWRNPNKKIL